MSLSRGLKGRCFQIATRTSLLRKILVKIASPTARNDARARDCFVAVAPRNDGLNRARNDERGELAVDGFVAL